MEIYARDHLANEIADCIVQNYPSEYEVWAATLDFDYPVNRDRYQLAQDVGGWFTFKEKWLESEFVPMNEWLKRYEEWEAKENK
jgi:hypothetical protein